MGESIVEISAGAHQIARSVSTLAVPFLGIQPKDALSYYRGACSFTPTAAVFTIASDRNSPMSII